MKWDKHAQSLAVNGMFALVLVQTAVASGIAEDSGVWDVLRWILYVLISGGLFGVYLGIAGSRSEAGK